MHTIVKMQTSLKVTKDAQIEFLKRELVQKVDTEQKNTRKESVSQFKQATFGETMLQLASVQLT